MSVTERKFGELRTGEEVRLFHLENASGAYAEVLDYGALLVKVCVPDKNGSLVDVVLGYDDLESYEKNGCFFGAVIGRSGNRIEGGKFLLDGQEVILAKNENENNLHSGPDGFEKKMWKVEEIAEEKNSLTLYRISPDGENGFPGEFRIAVKYELTDNNELKITYQGVSNKTTVANLTNHSYFNLSGEGSGDVLGQYLTIHGKYYTPVRDSQSIPTGVYEEVKGTPMDFTREKTIGADIDADFQQLLYTGGYDHNYVTDNYAKGNVRLIASAYSPVTGIAMDVVSDCPGVQFYAGNFIQNEKGKNGHIYEKRHGFCLETQVEPNAVNVEAFHSPVIDAGEVYHSVTGYRFYVKK
ncbi:MAG TPA: galactose mutarotase [Candidatus Blautia faecavium]|uniref:Aldose 1-epimerase n=1 Tax=Candidatus Blautia faecavium TaxID=2838487 RepID=A0A9D2RY44_9FIRM|nr:galactose mutarotase [Candidatus Blautia faecavium]